jgi:transcriptional regulator with XRE-family HTH domain
MPCLSAWRNRHRRAPWRCHTRQQQATKLSQDCSADQIDMHRAYYSAIVRGEKTITLDTLLRVADGFGVNASDLFGKAKL